MPFRRKRSNKRRRRKGRKRSTNRIHSVVIRGPSAFPDRVYVRLKYTNSIAISATALVRTKFSGNSLFRPDFTATTQMPRGFDQWMAVYNLYKVHKSTIRAEVLNLAPALTLDAVLLPAKSDPTLVDTEDAREQPYARSKRLSALSGNKGAVSLFNSMKTKVIYGTRFINDDYSAGPTGNPNPEWQWYLYIQNLVDDMGTVNCDISISLTYYVELFRRKFIPRSESGALAR